MKSSYHFVAVHVVVRSQEALDQRMLMRLDTTAYDNINESGVIIDQRKVTKHRLDKVKKDDHNSHGYR